MKTKNIFAILMLGIMMLGFNACQDGDWDAPDFSDGVPYGNNALTENNVITIAQLKAMYPAYSGTFSCLEITDSVQLRVRVSGNDVQGNIYNSIVVQDEEGNALVVGIAASDLYARMPVGQEMLIDLKGLYFGCYGAQPQLGTPYTNAAGNTFPSRMPHSLWQQHVKLLGKAEPEKIVPIDFDPKIENAGRLMTLRNVSVQGADGYVKWASKEDAGTYTSVQKYFEGMSNNYMIYTSTYAEFANTPIPTGKMNLTGIWKVYQTNSNYDPKWELVIRDVNDIEPLE